MPTPDLGRPTIGALMDPERRADQLRRIDERPLDLTTPIGWWFPVIDEYENEEDDAPLPPEPPEGCGCLTAESVRIIVHEELSELLAVMSR